MNKNKTIIFVAPNIASFIRNDISSLSKHYLIKTNLYNWKVKWLTPFHMIRQVFFVLRYIFITKAILISFGGYWAFIPSLMGKLFRVPVYIILNGADCASLPFINYGSLRKYPLRNFCKWSYNLATLLLPVSSSLISVNNIYDIKEGAKFNLQGCGHFFPHLTNKFKVVHNGLDTSFWMKPENVNKIPQSFIAVFSDEQFILKGGDLILQTSRKNPSCKFFIAGCKKPEHLNEDYSNVYFLGKLSAERLKEYYSKCQFHFQLSIYEGFGVALCEAMLCECVPIGSSVNSIPEIIGSTGFILQKREVDELNKLVKLVVSIDNKKVLGQFARKRIATEYNSQLREERLVSIINNQV